MTLYRAPGRVNLIGEHTDYNDGFVMPIAIDRWTTASIESRAGRTLAVRSEAYSEWVELDLDAPEFSSWGPTGHWSDYVRGVAAVLQRQGVRIGGAEMVVTSTVPAGAGLSSSAALEMAVGYALLDTAGVEIDRTALALACQQAEHEFAGTRCGLMDQYIVAHGSAGQALLLDTRTLRPTWLPLPAEVAVVVCNTMTKHALASAGYNDRRADCEAGVAILAARLPRVRALRDVTPADLEAHRADLSDQVYRRCRHVVSENARVEAAGRALQQGDLGAFGDLMLASHRSLRDDYEVSTTELDVMVEIANGVEGVYGSRMTGGGFGGCTVNLVRADSVAAFCGEVSIRYARATGRTPDVYPCVPSEGVHRWNG